MLTVITRWIDLHWDNAHRICQNWEDLIAEEEELFSPNLDDGIIKETKFTKTLTMKLCAKLSGFNQEDRNLFFELWFCDKKITSGSPTQMANIRLQEDDLLELRLAILLGKSIVSCACGTLAVDDGKCEDCYMFHLEKEDNCCVCLENGGKWYKLECGHSIHQHCILKTVLETPVQVQGKLAVKCPLCRHTTKEEDWKTE